MSARCGEDLDLSGIGPPAQRVRVNAEDAARFPQRQPVTALERAGLGYTANLGESDCVGLWTKTRGRWTKTGKNEGDTRPST